MKPKLATKMTPQLRICIIGAGAAGICAAKHLSKLTPALKSLENIQSVPKFLPMVFEKGSKVGGTWIYNDNNETEESLKEWVLKINSNEIHSSMYKNMYTNLPKEVMAYPDFCFPPETSRSFLKHTEVEEYLCFFKNGTNHRASCSKIMPFNVKKFPRTKGV